MRRLQFCVKYQMKDDKPKVKSREVIKILNQTDIPRLRGNIYE